MAEWLIKDDTLKDIGAEVRKKTGTTEVIKVSELAEKIGSIGENATATSNDILSGKIAYNGNRYVAGNILTRTSADLTSQNATITVPSGYYATQATKSISQGMAKTPATTITKNPTITIDNSGLITASVSGTQNITPIVTPGYVSNGV
jgi:hypothetical protein